MSNSEKLIFQIQILTFGCLILFEIHEQGVPKAKLITAHLYQWFIH